MQVLKFGGSSVATAENMEKVIDILLSASATGPTSVVLSAMGGVTDALISSGKLAASGSEQYKQLLQTIETRHLDAVRALIPVARQSSLLSWVKQRCNEMESLCEGIFLLGELSPRTLDRLVSYGEWLSSYIVSGALQSREVPHLWADSRQLIRTDSSFGNAKVDMAQTRLLMEAYVYEFPSPLYILPGFIASNAKGVTTTLGRGGSDYTAALVAASLHADVLEIWTDVSGMMTADPRWVSHARVIDRISYQEAMELSHFGAKVVYPPTIQPVMDAGIPVWIKNTFAPRDPGTLIEHEVREKQKGPVRGISSINDMALLSLEGSGMVGVPGVAGRLFQALASQSINVILITQGSSEFSICVGVAGNDSEAAQLAVNTAFGYEIGLGSIQPVRVENHLAVVALVGDNMKSHPGISGRMFGALGRNGVNVRAIAQGASEKNISAVVAAEDVKKAVNVLHEAFFETAYKQLNLYIVGLGNVGAKLMDQLKQQQYYLLKHTRLQLRVMGIANSRKMVLSDQGIDLATWQQALQDGQPMDLDAFVEEARRQNLRNSVFVDNTASALVASVYDRLLTRSIAVVACNKIACSSRFADYQRLKFLSRDYNANFCFETNVGAGLPVIGPLSDMVRSGDRVDRIDAVLSGTLNFVFNNYDGTRPFAEVVRQAQEEGYTEPDPRLDLGGTDVMRKILILARECGAEMEMDDITNNTFMPTSCMEGSVDDFYRELGVQEAHFASLYQKARANGRILKFVASFAGGKAQVGLQEVSPEHGFYHLYGKDNVVQFYTRRYPQQPLMVKGAGAGADVTASGVFADIIRAARI
ncbi:MAG TPA: bifunctional aspartate kinase/homoserine dehydrogenase I [Dinghuibacter sp.]|uniref:bifunctional aspartate kinase/homoserine dehydrogenase I n=1 Tax=Dinghuibacter sp. TaxID=2024697 RepID=UPI002C5A129B|nr:bifunctional aspartate kinase/homoserine dehydrogenase I [Dinghuibacter sp.]HTJ11512.1 bifunctional aspartate kinase/homoserine dehydrogenase I [Dinghuibacter sp.]